MPQDELDAALERRLPTSNATARTALSKAYRDGVISHAVERTTGAGPVPTNLGTERGDLLAHVSRALGRLLTEDEVAALLRIPSTAARSLRKTMLAVYDDLPSLGFKTAFAGAKRAGRGTLGAITDGYKISFASDERMEIAKVELQRRGHLYEVVKDTDSTHVLLIGADFPEADLPGTGK